MLDELRRLALVDARSFWDGEGRLKKPSELTPEQGAALAGFEVLIKNAKAGDGQTDEIHKIKLWDKTRALELRQVAGAVTVSQRRVYVEQGADRRQRPSGDVVSVGAVLAEKRDCRGARQDPVGPHSKFVLALIDESGAIPVTVLRAVEQALSNCAFGKILQAGNPISLEGMLYAAATHLAHLWHIIRITGDPDDPKRSPRIDQAWAQHQIDAYGRDNPWVLSYILGKFPPSSLNSLLGPEDVLAAMQRTIPDTAYQWAQARLGVDVARYGDDRTVIFPRQGKQAFAPKVMRHARDSAVSTDIATAVMAMRLDRHATATILDATGGWAAGASDVLRASGSAPVNVQFHASGLDQRYKNRRAEMWFTMAEWVQAAAACHISPSSRRNCRRPRTPS